jgi:very-short-patch-repair endonuclease
LYGLDGAVASRPEIVSSSLTDCVTSCASSRCDGTGRTYRFDFAFVARRTILETNGRRWHDDSHDYERDNEKWSVPGRHGYRVVFATWAKVTRPPRDLVSELRATLAA